ncbi:M20/M25/M40 family metallo-hydrolase [Litoribacter populi]|uniref:M20/M25/M40 family metallo-hydrolase n=1 Tax=Litoribacter populi TaxID=2598460 RepID=UPI00117E5747|nr:M20/M25/M40 family metallo-hydrolase [Litoribacter populi]
MKYLLKSAYLLLSLGVLVHFGATAQNIDKEKLIADIQYLSSDELEGRKPLTDGNLKAQKFIKERFDRLNLTSQYSDFTQYFSFMNPRDSVQYERAANIVGFIPGSESEYLIVITAHYDHLGVINGQIFNGADDNASGTAALLAMAEYFSVNRPKHSIMFAAVDAEEMGHQGAKALVADFPFPLKQVKLNINMDMISRNENNELYASGTFHNPHLKPVLEAVEPFGGVILKFGHDDPEMGKDDWTFSSDHAQFHRKDIPHIYFGVEDHPDYHKPTDTFENIDPDFYYQAAETVLRAVKAFDESL